MAHKFVSQDEPNINSFIKLIKCEVNANNNVMIAWEWPRDNTIKLVVVFQVKSGDESLTELLESDIAPVVITKGMEGSYNRPLEDEKAIFKLFPARFGKSGDIIVLNQQNDNTTDFIFAKVPVYYSIIYKGIPFSQLQKVTIKIDIPKHSIPVVKVQDLIMYEKNTGGYTIRYPIDDNAVSNGLTLYIKKNEQIYIKPRTPYENIVFLHKEV